MVAGAVGFVDIDSAISAILTVGPSSIRARRKLTHFLGYLEEPLCSRYALCNIVERFTGSMRDGKAAMIRDGVLTEYAPDAIWLARRFGLNLPDPQVFSGGLDLELPPGVEPQWPYPVWVGEKRMAEGMLEPEHRKRDHPLLEDPIEFDLGRVTMLREKLWHLKVRLLEETPSPLRSRDLESLTSAYVKLIATSLSNSDFEYLDKLMRLYPHSRVHSAPGGIGESYYGPLTGGLYDIFRALRFLYLEAQGGMFCSTAEGLEEFVGQGEDSQYGLTFADYWEVISHDNREIVDRALDNLVPWLSRLEEAEQTFDDAMRAVTEEASRSSIARILRLAPESGGKPGAQKFPTPPGSKWEDVSIEIVSDFSARVKVGQMTRTYLFSDMGFRDDRKGDRPNDQWDILVELAEREGALSWSTSGEIPDLEADDLSQRALPWGTVPATHGKGKNIQAIRRTLEEFLDISGDCFHSYRRGGGWVSRFKITDKRGQS